ncbi:hypothetical protein O3M35_006366 [Rhynocoris fuscipes]|uniref:Uncharacterized protein n=1 Tax=Rhynocoris fuscipes TaxID=488301 RepID=A0AAW1DFX0_9HEMI
MNHKHPNNLSFTSKYEQEAKRARKAAEELKKTTKNETNGDSTDDLAKAIMSRKQEREAQAENFFKSLEEKYGGKSKKKSSRKAK